MIKRNALRRALDSAKGVPVFKRKNPGTEEKVLWQCLRTFLELAAGEGFESPWRDFDSWNFVLSNAAKSCGARGFENHLFIMRQGVLDGFIVVRVK